MYTLQEDNSLDLVLEYAPSRNAVRRFSDRNVDPMEVEEKFIKINKEETDRCATKYNVRKDVRYGETGRQLMDIYFKEKEEGTPIFVYIHGGYWITLDKSISGVCVAPLVERGYRVVAMDYSLCPEYTLEQLVGQMNTFFRWILNYAGETKASSISFCGHSAGSHLLAAMINSDFLAIPNSHLVRSFFLVSGLYDLRGLWKAPIQEIFFLLMRKKPKNSHQFAGRYQRNFLYSQTKLNSL